MVMTLTRMPIPWLPGSSEKLVFERTTATSYSWPSTGVVSLGAGWAAPPSEAVAPHATPPRVAVQIATAAKPSAPERLPVRVPIAFSCTRCPRLGCDVSTSSGRG
jgi:hypothetical protein